MEILCTQAQGKLNDKVMVFIVGDEIAPTIGGLVANKLAPKYQRPVAIVRPLPDGTYAGSMRGYTATGIESFKDIAMKSEYCAWCMGHENAAGICLTDPDKFVEDMNEILKDVPTEIVYYVDYIYDAEYVEDDVVIALAELNDYLGTGFARPQIYVKDFKLTDFMVMKSNTLKFKLPCGIDIIKFAATEEEIETLNESIGKTVNFVCKCNINEWNGERNPQLMCIDYEIKDEEVAIEGWNSSWNF
jgi:single-stranded DNA-specific DHH superfamily exonuclease